ncbi:MAG: DinB family protein [Thermoguttaceae bacterium]
MTPKDVFQQSVESSHAFLRAELGDLSDADLLVRPVPGANHIAWQLGHMIAGTDRMLTALGQKAPALPEGFQAGYTRETAASDDPAKFLKKAEYLALADQMKAASLAAIAATPDSVLDDPGPEAMRHFLPTVGRVLAALGGHWLMHASQFVVVRRKLGKPLLF